MKAVIGHGGVAMKPQHVERRRMAENGCLVVGGKRARMWVRVSLCWQEILPVLPLMVVLLMANDVCLPAMHGGSEDVREVFSACPWRCPWLCCLTLELFVFACCWM